MKRGAQNGSDRTRVALGLALLRRRLKPGVAVSLDVIAVWAGCTRQNIQHIERRALRAVRVKLQLENFQ